MIKINLLGNTTQQDNSGKLILLGYVASVIVSVLLFVGLWVSTSGEVMTLTQNVESRREELKRWEKTTQEVKAMQAKEEELKKKLTVIGLLRKQKKGPVQVLSQLNGSIPEKAWLTGAREKESEFTLEGFALDNQTISQFLKALMQSEFFPKVELDETKLVEKDGVKVHQFSLKAKVAYGGKAESELKKDEQDKKDGK